MLPRPPGSSRCCHQSAQRESRHWGMHPGLLQAVPRTLPEAGHHAVCLLKQPHGCLKAWTARLACMCAADPSGRSAEGAGFSPGPGSESAGHFSERKPGPAAASRLTDASPGSAQPVLDQHSAQPHIAADSASRLQPHSQRGPPPHPGRLQQHREASPAGQPSRQAAVPSRSLAHALAAEDAAVLHLSGFGAQLLSLQLSPQGLGLSHGVPVCASTLHRHVQAAAATCSHKPIP